MELPGPFSFFTPQRPARAPGQRLRAGGGGPVSGATRRVNAEAPRPTRHANLLEQQQQPPRDAAVPHRQYLEGDALSRVDTREAVSRVRHAPMRPSTSRPRKSSESIDRAGRRVLIRCRWEGPEQGLDSRRGGKVHFFQHRPSFAATKRRTQAVAHPRHRHA